MVQHVFLYGLSSILIAAVLFAAILLANEMGYRYARRRVARANEGIKSQTNAIQAGMLGLLALLLGFSFNMALQRFDSRSTAVIEEANAIGTAYLRAQLLPEPQSGEIKTLFASYLRLRIAAGGVDMASHAQREGNQAETAGLQRRLWQVALAAAEKDPRPVTTGLFIQSLNEVIDAYGRRQAALQKHVPEVVLYLLFTIFIISGCILGYAAGLGGDRPWLATVSMAALIVLVIFIVIDLDRPRRGLIQVDQSSMTNLQLPLEKALPRP